MGTDNLFHKRKVRTASELTRRKARREPYAKVLIVCEGEKTEPNYFNGLRDCYGLNSANVEVCGDCGTDPIGIVKYAKRRYKEERDAGDAFDRVYCVFDKDSHHSYNNAKESIRTAKPKNVYFAITSVPCFEYWLLLHFDDTTKPFRRCEDVITVLKNHMPGYNKGQRDTFSFLINKLDAAKKNAHKAIQAATSGDTDNPTTQVHELVEYLQNIKTIR